MGAQVRKDAATPAEEGGYATNLGVTDINKRLSRSMELEDRQWGGDR